MHQQLSDHLDFLVGGPADAHGGENSIIEEWIRLQQRIGPSHVEQEATVDDIPWTSVTDVYESTSSSNSLFSQILHLRHDADSLLYTLRTILSSNHSDDDVSTELAETIGFENIELVMQILGSRADVLGEIDRYLAKQSNGSGHDTLGAISLDPLAARQRIEQQLRENASKPLFTGITLPEAEILPHVYTSSSMSQNNKLSQYGNNYLLPLGTTRETYEDHEEVVVPPAKPVPPRSHERLVPVSDLDPLARGCFPGYATLNRIQSIVYPTAYRSNENMLVCAPTGAGKTDVAMLTILRVLDQHRTSSTSSSSKLGDTINRDSFKIIYVAPMKALASEIVQKFSKRLRWLSIEVRELTGDMQMTKAEIAQTQIIVTTPEKWDVVTRKPTGEGEIASLLKLLIIDEVHLLNEERGAVIETIVARTLRQAETTQSVIRIVGLSATLPNYVDVSDFLSVSRQKGLFYFDSSFRPVPLEQHFLGIKGKAGTALSKKNLDHVTYEKVRNLVEQGHQVMVFVHARKETVKAAMALKDTAEIENAGEFFKCDDNPQWPKFRQQIGQSRNREMKQLFDYGFGIHHAGMLRSDRNMMEQMFRSKAIKVLCCTATLAWGVNLPAHAVVIKGTQVYDSSKGSFVDLSVLDVLQVFGRAGRPGLETSGEGYICTPDEKLEHYLQAVTSQNPIESQFKGGMIDALNAEISLGTVSNVNDAVQWLGYTYLFVRMRKNPFVYGIARDVLEDDPQLGQQRNELVTLAAQKLHDAQMITYDQPNGTFTILDLGRIAARYYIRFQSIEIFNKEFKPRMTEADVLAMLSMSTEFDQIQTRDSELDELSRLLEAKECDVKGVVKGGEIRETISGPDKGTEIHGKKIEISSQAKVNILLQSYISRKMIDDFALVSDSAYVAQNAGRIVRALLEIAISKKWATVSSVLMGLSKAVEKRLWPFAQPLLQFDLKPDVFYGLETWADDWTPSQLASMSAEELGALIHLNVHHGQALLNAAKQVPAVTMKYDLRPLGCDILKIAVHVMKDFTWSNKVHGTAEPFWLWIEDHEGLGILQFSHTLFKPTADTLHVDFIIPIAHNQPPPSVTVRYVSDRWIGAEQELSIPLDALRMPRRPDNHTPLLDLPLLPLTSVRNMVLDAIFAGRVHNFNPLQTQSMWSLINTRSHSLFCAPVGCGKSTMSLVLIWAQLLKTTTSWILVITPHRNGASEVLSNLRMATHIIDDVTVAMADYQNVLRRTSGRRILITTSHDLCQAMISRDPQTPLNGLDLVVCEDLESMDSKYELGVSLLRHATQFHPTRFVGLSNSLHDSADLASWLDVDEFAFHSFRPSDRNYPLVIKTQSFSIPQSASLFKAMAKPAHDAIRGVLFGDSAVVFVPSRGQCQFTALDLLTRCALENQTDRGYRGSEIPDEHLEHYLARLSDRSLVDFISKGVGIFHDGIPRRDRGLILQLYVEGLIRVLLVPREACWSLPVRAGVVVVAGTQYMQYTNEGQQLRDYDLPELVRMQSRAVRHSGTGHFHLFCQAEAKDTYLHFLNDGLPLESTLIGSQELKDWFGKHSEFSEEQNMVDALSFTYLARRMVSNPVYYDCPGSSLEENMSWVADRCKSE
ncbi:putative steryl acetyl hydrolase mug81 [Marasmius tenuissimus]|nr:putative steryl acetyl hydrolase mug81 [Marasmius tenuissimus]